MGRLRTTEWRPVGERVAKTPERLWVESEESDEDNDAYAEGYLSDDWDSEPEGFDVDALCHHFAAGPADHDFVDDTIGLFC